jgi:D-alanyl-D-alanine-carboxypeptidase/D-alanyl-D-alanine-endopeptidase
MTSRPSRAAFSALGLLLALLSPPAISAAQTAVPAAPAPVATTDSITLALQERVASAPGTGIVVGLIDHGKTTLYQAGTTGGAAPLDEHTMFEIGSVTKTFTATILASMVLDRSVALDDPVAKFLPKNVRVPARGGKQITLLNLATQHSGLPRLPDNLNSPDGADPYAVYTLQDLYHFLDGYKLPRDPGASFEYSNLGIGLLGDALALRAHTTYPALLRARVLAPLGMNDTTIGLSPAQQSRFAVGHDADGTPVKPWTFQAIAPAGAVRSNLDDMLKYLRCNMGRGPLARACLFAQRPRDTFPGNHIGLVWWTSDGEHFIHHGGDTAGYHAAVALTADRERGVVVLTNGGRPGVEDVAFHVLDPAFPLTRDSTAVPLDEATLASYVGTYEAKSAGIVFTIARAGAGLTAQIAGQPSARIYASAKDKFFFRVVEAQIDFTRDESGKVNALILRQNGQTLVAVRPGAVAPPATAVQPSYPPVVALDAATFGEYVGTYAVAPGVAFVVRRTADGIEAQLTGQPFFPLFASAKDRFYYKVVPAQIDFQRDAGGHVSGLTLHQNGHDVVAAKQ